MTLFMYAPVGPPTTGVTTATEAVYRILSEALGQSPELVNLTPPADSRPRSLGKRLAQEARSWALLLRNRGALHYRVPSGDHGLLLDLVWAVVARSCGARTVLHHHSFSYLSSGWQRWMMGLLCRGLGSATEHLVLCECMSRRLREVEGVERVRVLDNRGLLAPEGEADDPSAGDDIRSGGDVDIEAGTGRPRITIGHLGWLSQQKGTDLVIDAVKLLRQQGVDARLLLAGSVEPNIQAQIRQHETGWLRYLGPLYRAAKAEFFEEIDLFALPTRYPNEAQPFVIYEASRAGCYVLAADRGCIAEQLSDPSIGRLVEPTTEAVARSIEKFLQDKDLQSSRDSRRSQWQSGTAVHARVARSILTSMVDQPLRDVEQAPVAEAQKERVR